jgi:RNA polymerase-binding protein DksA
MALTQQQTQELHATVERRRAALRAEIDHDLDKVRADRLEDLAGASPDPGDESVASLISDLDQADTSRDLSELRSLDAAHERIADGSYGTCSDCGGEIAFDRLRANPAAQRCIRCQTQYEKTHASPTGSTL